MKMKKNKEDHVADVLDDIVKKKWNSRRRRRPNKNNKMSKQNKKIPTMNTKKMILDTNFIAWILTMNFLRFMQMKEIVNYKSINF